MNKLLISTFLLMFCKSFSQNYVTDLSLDKKYIEPLSLEVDSIGQYLEYGKFNLNIADSTSYFVEQKKVFGRFKIDTIFNDSFYLFEPYVDDLIAIIDMSGSGGSSKMDASHLLIPYLKYRGKLIVLMNRGTLISKDFEVNTGTKEYDDYLMTIFRLLNIEHTRL